VGPSNKLKTNKYRMMVVVRSELTAITKIQPDLMNPAVQNVWIQIDLGNRFLVGGVYIGSGLTFPRSTRPAPWSRPK
jgi:hypothetical protein